MVAVPLLLKDRLLGVFEFGTFGHFNATQEAFIDSVLPTVALGLDNICRADETQLLLDHTRAQAEELQVSQLFDQSVFVRAAVEGVLHEALIAAEHAVARGGEVGGHGAAHVAEAEEQNGGHGVLLVGTGCGAVTSRPASRSWRPRARRRASAW